MATSRSKRTPVIIGAAAVAFCLAAAVGYWHRASRPGAAPPAPPDGARDGREPESGMSRELAAEEIERRAAAAYERASAAVVRVEDFEGAAGTFPRGYGGVVEGGFTGVIVTPDGHVVCKALLAGTKVTFRLSDGRRVTGIALGWSSEWGVGLVKLDGPGPWPHVQMADPGGVKAGQTVITLAYPVYSRLDLGYRGDPTRPAAQSRPLLNVGWVTHSAPGHWFLVSKDTAGAKHLVNAGAVFDLDGRLAGVGWTGYGREGRHYADAKVVRTLWDDLAAGKNLDRIRLGGSGRDGGPAVQNPPLKGIIPREVEEAARAASVRIRPRPDDKRYIGPVATKGWSGTLVTADGLVATCAHHFVMPGTKVVISLPDGRDAAGTVVGMNLVCDVGLVRITAPGPWPHVERGTSGQLRSGDPCLFVGYGPTKDEERQPRVRRTTTVAPPPDLEHVVRIPSDTPLFTDGSGLFEGGDSGGGVFDAGGRLVAIHKTIGGPEPGGRVRPHEHPRVELFRLHWDELNSGRFEQAGASPLGAAKAEVVRAGGAGVGVVEVLDGQKVVALGTVVGRDGRILTLANLLPETVTCRLADGRVLPAAVVRTIREHNLAVLKVDAAGLKEVEWSAADAPPVGALVALASPAGPAAGVVSHAAVTLPAERAVLSWVNLGDGARGLEVTEVYATPSHSLLQVGDSVLSVDGAATPNLAAYQKYVQSGSATAGDAARVLVLRGQKKVELRLAWGPPPPDEGQSLRHSGFPAAYSVAADPESTTLCGGPVVGRDGRAVGVAVAWRCSGWLLVIPCSVARALAAEPPK